MAEMASERDIEGSNCMKEKVIVCSGKSTALIITVNHNLML